MMINQFIVGEVQKLKTFLEFDQIYKNCKVFKLEQNYRSTKNILDTASNLISNNQNRVGKKLMVKLMEEGELVKLNCFTKLEKMKLKEFQMILIEKKLKKKYSLNDVWQF